MFYDRGDKHICNVVGEGGGVIMHRLFKRMGGVCRVYNREGILSPYKKTLVHRLFKHLIIITLILCRMGVGGLNSEFVFWHPFFGGRGRGWLVA